MNGNSAHPDEALAAAGRAEGEALTASRAERETGPSAEALETHYRVQYFGIVNPDEMGRSDSSRVAVEVPGGARTVDLPEVVAAFIREALGRTGKAYLPVKKEYNGYEDAGYIAFENQAEAERAYESLLEYARRALSCTATEVPGEDIYLSFDVKLMLITRTPFETPARKADRTRLNGETIQAWWDQDSAGVAEEGWVN